MGSKTFGYSRGDVQKFNVPAGVKLLHVTVDGASSGPARGGRVTGRMRVTGRTVLWIRCGEGGNRAYGALGYLGGKPTIGGGGWGGNGRGTGLAGDSGAGATIIRNGGRTGRIMAVAGGAGGTSGDGAQGGHGGASIGGPGGIAEPPGVAVASATGGTQNQGGRGGTTVLGTAYYGGDADGVQTSRGGSGGFAPDMENVNGGGGGGGGYFPGGGGMAGRPGVGPAGGGAGGSNFTGGLYSVQSFQGGAPAGNGSVTITWEDPGGNTPPVPPQSITIDGKNIQDGLATESTGRITIKGTPDDPDGKQDVRMLVRISQGKAFNRFSTFKGTFDKTEKRDVVQVRGLRRNTLYYVRFHTQDHRGKISTNYASSSFWTNRPPLQPLITEPTENAQFTPLVNVTLAWQHRDPDRDNAPQGAFRIRYRTSASPATEAGEWVALPGVRSSQESWVIDAGTFQGNTFYDWEVRTRDAQGSWGDWSEPASFFVIDDTQPPLLTQPTNNMAVVAADDMDFRWVYRSPLSIPQSRIDLRYRIVGTPDWITLLAVATTEPMVTLPADTFVAKGHYEWQVRSYGGDVAPSEWSDSGYFYGVASPGDQSGTDLITFTPAAPIGQGNNRAFLYERGGMRYLGEIGDLAMIRWGRVRDDISGALLRINEWDDQTRELLRSLHTWMHEIVIFRDNGEKLERVWEGPITRISGTAGYLEIEAKDVGAYFYRRILRQGYSDSYRLINGVQVGQSTVVQRAGQIIMNALAYDDPNVLPFLTMLHDAEDARTSRVVKDYTKTAWEEVDDLAANAGLDYTTVGRRVVLWDTHMPVGRLPEMRSGDFSDPPIVTEYGMSASNVFGVTNNGGVYGVADRLERVKEKEIALNEFPTPSEGLVNVEANRPHQVLEVSDFRSWNDSGLSWRNSHLNTSPDQYHRIGFTNLPYKAGDTRTFRVRVLRADANNGTFDRVTALFRDETATTNYALGVPVTVLGDLTQTNTWVEVEVTHTVPPGRNLTGVYIDVRVKNRGATDRVFFDGAQTHDGPYFTGDSPDTWNIVTRTGFKYQWLGRRGSGYSRKYQPGYDLTPPQGFVEQLASSYGQEEQTGETQELDRAALQALKENLAEQADRNIASRWPPPLHVRIPDNATLSPHLNLGINNLIPGVWIPLRASGGVREVEQWQKLDSMTVEQTAEGEKISVIMSPAPNQGEDPDAQRAAEEAV